MANREFISAKDLPVTEAEEVDVLCVEPTTGELMKKSGANFGGGEKTDLVLNFTSPLLAGSFAADNTSVTIESGSLEVIAEVLRSGRPPVVKVKHFCINNEELPFMEGGVYDCSVVLYNTGISFTFVVSGYEVRVSMDIEDTDLLQVWVFPFTKTTIQVI